MSYHVNQVPFQWISTIYLKVNDANQQWIAKNLAQEKVAEKNSLSCIWIHPAKCKYLQTELR